MAPPPFNMPRRDSVPQWNLLPVALNELASVGADATDNDVDHALEMGVRISQKTIERYQYRLWSIDHACGHLARACHTSKRTVLRHILPFLIAIFRSNEEIGRATATAMELDERDITFLSSEANIPTSPTGLEEALDPTGFKLPFMGKEKFIQLMRAGIKYDSVSRKFSVRRMDNLDSVEESLSQIVSKPVRFTRPDITRPKLHEEQIAKSCYVDGNVISCETCKFLDDCPTHVLAIPKSCICDETISDPHGYEKYVAKNEPSERPTTKPRKKVASKKKTTSAG
jgi:hypothetical protein